MSTSMLIGLVGRKGAGKDTVADFIADELEGVTRLSLAGPIKQSLAAMFGVDERAFHDRDTKDVPVFGTHTPRDLCIWLGTAARETFGNEFWVDRTLGAIDKHSPTIVTDVRFTNEADKIIRAGGTLVYVDADERIGPMEEGDPEESIYTVVGSYATTRITNNGDLPALRASVQWLLDILK